jgi:hypothetical protein
VIGRVARVVVTIGLGACAGAVLPARAGAQEPAPRDTIAIPLPPRADSMIRNDSIALGTIGGRTDARRDSIQPPLARPESPPVLELGAARVYDRAAIFATGALTLSDILGRVPGITTLATGWLVAPTAVASLGDMRRLRIFLDGLELDPMDQREQGRAPVNDLPLHTLEELRIERGADEVRVYARSWRVTSTAPFTRADVLTGDQNTNLYRGYFGRRYGRGEALQVSAEQLNTQPNSRLPSADGRSYMLRAGMIRGPWRADVMGLRAEGTRDDWVGLGNSRQTLDTIAPLATRRSTGYLRIANGDPDAPQWGQLVASAHGFVGSASASFPGDTLASHDSTTYESQYLLTGGVRRGPFRLSAAERLRVASGRSSAVPSLRASMETDPLALSLFGEGRGPLSPARVEATARVALLGRVTLLAAGARSAGGVFDRVLGTAGASPVIRSDGTITGILPGPVSFDSAAASRYELPASTSLRAEAGVRVRDLQVSGGLIRRGPTTLLPAAGLGAQYTRAGAVRPEGAATAATAALRGRIYRAVNIDAWGLAWNDTAGLYRPRYQSRAELYLQTSLLERFPRGNFGLLTSLAHEYRSNTRFAVTGDSVRTALGGRTLDFKLEIRIQTAVISYQFRNLLQENRAQVPGFFLPRQTQFYGVRWDFWN